MRNSQRGFTLIEIMVVIAIISALVAATSVGVVIIQKRQKKIVTQNRLNVLGAFIENLKNNHLGYYPPTDSAAVMGPGIKGVAYGKLAGRPNDTNVGIESLFLVMHLPEIPGVEEFSQDTFANTDEDEMNAPVGDLPTREFYEVVDGWGNPFVYFHNAVYKDPDKVARYMLKQGGEWVSVKVLPLTGKTGFRRAGSFQLFSVGPDGEPGTDDDILFGEF